MTLETAPNAEQMQNEWDAVAKERDGTAEALPDNEPAAKQAPAEADPVQAAAAKPEPTLADVVAQLSAIQAQNKVFDNELKRTSGRVSAVQSQLALGAKAATAVKDAPTKQQQAEASKDPQEWEELKRDYPEWGTATEKLIGARLEKAISNLPAQQSAAPGMDEAAVEARVNAALAKREGERIERTHKGWSHTVNTAEFKSWQAKQPAEVQALGASPYAEDAVEMLNLFEKAKTPQEQAQTLQQERQKKLENASNGNPGRSATPVSGTKELTDKELWALEARKREDKRKARG